MRGGDTAIRDAISVVATERAGRVLGESVAVALAISGAQERGNDLEIPIANAARLAPEVGQTQVDIQFEQLYA